MSNVWVASPFDIQLGRGLVWYNVLKPVASARMLIGPNGNPLNPASDQWTAVVKGQGFAVGQEFWDGTNIEICTIAGTAGTGSEPSWAAVGSTTADGSITWKNLGPPYPLGMNQGEAVFHTEAALEDVKIDQETGLVDSLMVSESASIEVTLLESSIKKIAYALPHATYSTGTDTGLPTGAQAYEQLDVGGLVSPGGIAQGAFPAVAVISQRPQSWNPGYGTSGTVAGRFMVATIYGAVPSSPLAFGFTSRKEATYRVTFRAQAQLWRPVGQRMAQFYRQT